MTLRVGDRLPDELFSYGERPRPNSCRTANCSIRRDVPHPTVHASTWQQTIINVWPKMYQVGEMDPTPHDEIPENREMCAFTWVDARGEWGCTWLAGTDHPAQHVAGDGNQVCSVALYIKGEPS